MVKLVKGSAVIIRNGGEIKLTKIKFNIKNKDIIRTTQSGKVLFTLLGGDHVFMAPNTEIKYVENKGKKGLVNILNRNLHLKGRLLARIRKNLARTVVIRTANAIVGVKGTEFVTEFINKTTNVGTIKGLVSLTSLANNQSVELKEGTMSSVNIDGEVLQPSEFSGILMRDFEFAGEKMSGEDAAGKKIKLD
jgi:ferric-dicitrate binding protein FerR (iron transport regulator)